MSVLWLYLSGLMDLQADQYPLLTEFRVHAVSNKDKVFLPRFMVQVQSKKTVNPSTNDEIPLTYSRDEENKVGKIFIISVG